MEIHYPQQSDQAENLAKNLLDKHPTILGFDIECSNTQTSIISLCHLENSATIPESDKTTFKNKYDIYIFQINKVKISPSLVKILENDTIIKTGVGTKNDASKLSSINIKLDGLLELSHLAMIKRYPLGLKELYSTVFPDAPVLPKVNHQNTDWNGELTPELLDYAAC